MTAEQLPNTQATERLFARCQKHWPDFGQKPIFDVGANVGQSYRLFRHCAPAAPIHAFEPASETFVSLERAMKADGNATANAFGLAAKAGTALFTTGLDTANQKVAAGQVFKNTTDVSFFTGDSYCSDKDISQIGFLKVDTEGHDLEVLLGFATLLREGRIDCLQVECTTNLDNRFHSHLERFIHFLHPFGYRLSDILEPHRRVNRTRQNLRGIWYCNAVFMREVSAPKLRRDGVN